MGPGRLTLCEQVLLTVVFVDVAVQPVAVAAVVIDEDDLDRVFAEAVARLLDIQVNAVAFLLLAAEVVVDLVTFAEIDLGLRRGDSTRLGRIEVFAGFDSRISQRVVDAAAVDSDV